MDIVTLPLLAAADTIDTAIRRLNEDAVRMLVVAASHGGYRVHRSPAVLDGWRRRYVAIGELDGGDRVVTLRGTRDFDLMPPTENEKPALEQFLDDVGASFGLARLPREMDRSVTVLTRHEGFVFEARSRMRDCVCQRFDTHNDTSPPSMDDGSCPTCGSGWVCA